MDRWIRDHCGRFPNILPEQHAKRDLAPLFLVRVRHIYHINQHLVQCRPIEQVSSHDILPRIHSPSFRSRHPPPLAVGFQLTHTTVGRRYMPTKNPASRRRRVVKGRFVSCYRTLNLLPRTLSANRLDLHANEPHPLSQSTYQSNRRLWIAICLSYCVHEGMKRLEGLEGPMELEHLG